MILIHLSVHSGSIRQWPFSNRSWLKSYYRLHLRRWFDASGVLAGMYFRASTAPAKALVWLDKGIWETWGLS